MAAIEQRKLGSLTVPALGLGCMSMSSIYGPAEDEASIALIHHALDRGEQFARQRRRLRQWP